MGGGSTSTAAAVGRMGGASSGCVGMNTAGAGAAAVGGVATLRASGALLLSTCSGTPPAANRQSPMHGRTLCMQAVRCALGAAQVHPRGLEL